MTDADLRLLIQADDYVHALVPRADWYARGAPLWHGWAVREAWLAGYRAASNNDSNADSAQTRAWNGPRVTQDRIRRADR